MEMANLILEYLRVLLSPQIVGGVVAIIFLFVFEKELKVLIGRVASIRFPGGELSTSQIERATEVPLSSMPSTLPERPVPIEGGNDPTPQDFEQLRQMYTAEKIQSRVWEYRFLNMYLVRQTQEVLDWFIVLEQPTTFRLVDTHWMQFIPDFKEREAILNALLNHHLVEQRGELLQVTPKGHEYARWRGPLPKIVS